MKFLQLQVTGDDDGVILVNPKQIAFILPRGMESTIVMIEGARLDVEVESHSFADMLQTVMPD